MIFVIGNKRNLHVDEAFSYGLANHDGMAVNIEEGYTYQPADRIWLAYMIVGREERFCYRNVWENQASDVHPPLYYVLLHTICSLFPGRFSMWFAGLFNIVFACGTLYFLRKLALLFSNNEKLQRLLSIAFISSSGVLSAVGFLRMYIVAMFWVTALTYLLLKRFEGNGWRFYIALFFCMVCGALTHYYCVLYAVSISVAYGSLLLLRAAAEHSEDDCLFIYDRNWRILPAYFEVSNYRSVTFLREENLGRLDSMELSSRDELIVVTDGENQEAVKQIMDRCLLLDSYEYLGQYASTATYYLYGE